MTTDPTARQAVVYDAIDAFQRTHRLPGLQHAQIRGLLAEHLARVLPGAFAALEPAVVSSPLPDQTLRDRIAEALLTTHHQEHGFHADCVVCAGDVSGLAAAVLAVLPPPADRAALERIREVVHRLANHAVGFQDVLDDSDRGPWAKTVGADIAELRRLAAETQQDGAGEPAELRTLPREVRRLVHAVDRMRSHWAETKPDSPERHELWVGVHEANDAVWGRFDQPAGARQQADTEACTAWRIDSHWRNAWQHWSPTHEDEAEVREEYESTVADAGQRWPFRLVRLTTTATVVAEHQPPAAADTDQETP